MKFRNAFVAILGIGLGFLSQTYAKTQGTENLFRKDFRIKPGEFAEVNLSMDKGNIVIAKFSASKQVDWNLHSHKENKKTIHKKGLNLSGQDKFEAHETGVFSYLWKNTSEEEIALHVEASLVNGAKIHSWHGVDRNSQEPAN